MHLIWRELCELLSFEAADYFTLQGPAPLGTDLWHFWPAKDQDPSKDIKRFGNHVQKHHPHRLHVDKL